MKNFATFQLAKIMSVSSCGSTAGSHNNILYKPIISFCRNALEILRSSRRMTEEKKLSTINQKPSTNSGFTLVELAIVIVIIGFLVSGVLVGQRLVDSAKTNRAVSDLKKYDAAIQIFKLKYNVLPGDMPNAYTMFDGSGGSSVCGSNTWNSNTGCNGDGNGFIGASVADMRENGRLWVHLSLAKILSEAITYKSTSGYAGLKTSPQDANAPLSTISDGAVFDFYSSRYEGQLYAQSGLWLGITSVSAPWANPVMAQGRFGYANTMTPEMAFAIDTKMDDGLPTTGSAVAISSAASSGQCATTLSNYSGTGGATSNSVTPIAPSATILYNTSGANNSKYNSCNILLKTVYE